MTYQRTVLSSGGSSAVTSVAGKTGVVTLAKGDVGLGSVDNTADANKPTTAAVSTLLAGKAATSHTHTMANITDLAAALTAITDRLTALETP